MINEKYIPELVNLANKIILSHGKEKLAHYQGLTGMCACMGPSKGEYFCPCKQHHIIRDYNVEILSHIDEELAKKVMIEKIVAALPG